MGHGWCQRRHAIPITPDHAARVTDARGIARYNACMPRTAYLCSASLLRAAVVLGLAAIPSWTAEAAPPAHGAMAAARKDAAVHINNLSYDRGRHSLVLDISGQVTISTRSLKAPPRLVVDIPSASLESHNRELSIHDDMIQRVRISQWKIFPPTVRVVIETSTATEPLIAVQQTGVKLYITLAPARGVDEEPKGNPSPRIPGEGAGMPAASAQPVGPTSRPSPKPGVRPMPRATVHPAPHATSRPAAHASPHAGTHPTPHPGGRHTPRPIDEETTPRPTSPPDDWQTPRPWVPSRLHPSPITRTRLLPKRLIPRASPLPRPSRRPSPPEPLASPAPIPDTVAPLLELPTPTPRSSPDPLLDPSPFPDQESLPGTP